MKSPRDPSTTQPTLGSVRPTGAGGPGREQDAPAPAGSQGRGASEVTDRAPGRAPRRRGARFLAVTAAAALLATAAACGSDDDGEATGDTSGAQGEEVTVRLLTHDSFNVSDAVLEAFTAETGIRVEVLHGGDAVTVVNQAILTAGNPEADVLFGIDQNLLGAAREAELFDPYEPADLSTLDPDVVVDPGYGVTPVDRGDVCVNYDREWFAESGIEVPSSLADLTDPDYEGLLVVQNPATSTPGLAFLSGTVSVFGDPDDTEGADDSGSHDDTEDPDGATGSGEAGDDAGIADFTAYWEALRANDVAVSDGWEDAYYGQFSGGSGEGERPLVVSYATSPPVEVVYSEAYEATGELPDEAPTGVLADTCVSQVEYAGVLRGTSEPEAARRLVDLLISEELQADVPLSMFVEPVREGVDLPEVFTRFSEEPGSVIEVDPESITRNRDRWVEAWTETVLR